MWQMYDDLLYEELDVLELDFDAELVGVEAIQARNRRIVGLWQRLSTDST